MSYSSSGVLGALEFSPIGGGPAYSESAGKLHPSEADVEVSTADGLLEALDGPADVIAIANDAVIDLTGVNMTDLGSKTLVSYRGWDGQDGALIYTDSRGYYGSRPYTLFYSFGSPRVTGLRIRGARYDEEFTRWDYADNLARAIMLRGPGGEIDNCELWGWTWNAIHLKGYGEQTLTEAEVHHNHIHQSYQLGYGYGVSVWRGFGEIHHNYFDEVRRSISGYGWWNSGYVVENNVFGPQHQSHSIDMHCLEENDANARVGDDQDHPDYDLRAGGEMVIRNNTFTYDTNVDGGPANALATRGVPWDGVWIEDNRFSHPERPPYNSGNDQEGFAWRQVNLNLSGWDPIPQDDEGYTLDWNDSGNQFGAPDTPWEPGLGAPIDLEGEGNVITIAGGGPRAHYTFSVDGDVETYGASISNEDEITSYESDDLDTIVTGAVAGGNDSFVVGGDITSLSIESSADVLINGEVVDPTQFEETVITIAGRGSRANYVFEFAGNVETYGGSIDSGDKVFDSRVEGAVAGGADSFAFEGEITNFNSDSPVDVSFNGQPTGLWFEPRESETILTIAGGGPRAHYTFSVDGDVETYGASISNEDEITSYESDDLDTIVTGAVAGGNDSFVVGGDITSLSIESSADVLINGEVVDPTQFGETVITIAGQGSRANYVFEFAGNVTAYGGSISNEDEIFDSRVEGAVAGGADSFAFEGEITNFNSDSPVDVSFNGQPTGPWF